MLSWTKWAALLGVGCLASAAAPVDDNTTFTTVPGAYMVELADGEDSNAFYESLETKLGGFTTRVNITSPLLRAVSFRLHDASDDNSTSQKISDMPHVKNLWPVKLVPAPNPRRHWTGAGLSPEQLKKRAYTNDTYTPHRMTQVDKLHELGYTGKGIKLAIVDTGVDYTHPALGGCFGPGCLVSFGTDLVGDDYTGYNTPVPDSDPIDQCMGHGTHVAGIIAAQENAFDFTGAAPDVTLGMYRVFGCYDASGVDVLIAAFYQAYEDGANIITASIGGYSGWSEESWSVAVQRIVEAGVPCTIAAGNDGYKTLFYMSGAAGGKGVMAIGSAQNDDTATFEDGVYTSTRDYAEGGYTSVYSSWGPMFELEVKPQFSTPGGGIMSTWPVPLGSYAVLSGTSMATPLAASIVALIAQVRGTKDPATIERLLSSTANANVMPDSWWPTSHPILTPVAKQGAGLLQAYDAAFATSLLNVSSLGFNDTDHIASQYDFTITNTGTEAVTYNISHSPAITVLTLWAGAIFRISWVPDMVEVYADMHFEPSSLTIEPGATGTVSVFPTPPVGLDPQQIPIYSGFVVLNGTNGDNLSIPYQGAASSMRNVTVFDPRLFLSRAYDDAIPTLLDNTTFVLPAPSWDQDAKNASYYANMTDELIQPYGYLPAYWMILVMGSAQVRVEVVPVSDCSACNMTEIFGKPTLGNIGGYPSLYNPGAAWPAIWDGTLDNGNYAPAGAYKLTAMALKIFGDVNNADDYESIDSVFFNIVYAHDDL